MHTFHSEDGLHWSPSPSTRLGRAAVGREHSSHSPFHTFFDGRVSFFVDDRGMGGGDGRYRLFVRDNLALGTGRSIAHSESADAQEWQPLSPIRTHWRGGSLGAEEQLYAAVVRPLIGAPHIYVMFATRCLVPQRGHHMWSSNPYFRCSIIVMVSRDRGDSWVRLTKMALNTAAGAADDAWISMPAELPLRLLWPGPILAAVPTTRDDGFAGGRAPGVWHMLVHEVDYPADHTTDKAGMQAAQRRSRHPFFSFRFTGVFTQRCVDHPSTGLSSKSSKLVRFAIDRGRFASVVAGGKTTGFFRTHALHVPAGARSFSVKYALQLSPLGEGSHPAYFRARLSRSKRSAAEHDDATLPHGSGCTARDVDLNSSEDDWCCVDVVSAVGLCLWCLW